MALCLLSTLLLLGPADLRLQGVVVSAKPERSIALVSSEGRARVLGPGERAFGVLLVSVSADRVVLEQDGQRRELLLSGAAGDTRLGARVGARLDAPAAATPGPIAYAGESPGLRTLERADVERRLVQEIPRILAETTLLPVSDEGHVTGFTITRLPEGSLLSEIGLLPGDVLTEINGTPIDSIQTLAGLYTRLRSESEIRAVVLRGGSSQMLLLRLR